MKEISFIATDARCRHGEILPPDQDTCIECQFEEEVMRMKPPFMLKCIQAGFGILANNNYTVKVVLRDGDTAFDTGPGVLLLGDKDQIFPTLFSTSKFVWPDKEA